MNKIVGFALLIMLLPACRETKVAPRPAVFSLQQIGKLATAEYLVTRVVKAQDNETWYKVGDRKLLLSCTAAVKAGIDFSKLQPQQVAQQEKKITVLLPPVQILNLNIAPENIKVAYTDVGVFRDAFTTAEINSIMRTAQNQITEQVKSLDIFTTARTNATAFVTQFLTNAGFTEVYVSYQ